MQLLAIQACKYEYICRSISSSLVRVYLLPGLAAPPGLPTPFGMRDPVGLIISGGLAPLDLLISGRADFTRLIDPVLFPVLPDCLFPDPFIFCSLGSVFFDSVFLIVSESFCRKPILAKPWRLTERKIRITKKAFIDIFMILLYLNSIHSFYAVNIISAI